jgi:hypothetical protein
MPEVGGRRPEVGDKIKDVEGISRNWSLALAKGLAEVAARTAKRITR